MENYDTEAMSSTLRIRFENGISNQTREALIREIRSELTVKALVREGREWYLTFDNTDIVDRHGDTTIESSTGTTFSLERIDKRRVKFRIHWYPFHMKPEPVFHLMNKYGTDVKMNYDTNNYEGISLKPGAMFCTESEVQDLPYRGIIANKRVPITVVGRVNLYAVMSTAIREPLVHLCK